LEQAVKGISPSVVIQSDVVNLDGKTVLVATIQKGLQSPHLVDGQVFQRVGDRITPITSNALYNNIQERATSIDDILSEVKRLSMTIEQLNKELIAAKNWRSKIADMVLGGIIGALISIALAILLGIG
jgi:predicted HTH transcriptional regulator